MSAHRAGRLQRRQLEFRRNRKFLFFFGRRRRRRPSSARAFPSSSTVSSMTADLSRIPHHHRRHHRFVLVLARGKRLSVFSARRSDERGIIRVRRGESCQRRHPRAIRAPNTPRPFPESECAESTVTPFFSCFFPGKLDEKKRRKK